MLRRTLIANINCWWLFAVALLLSQVLAPQRSDAQRRLVPAEVQAAIFNKVFKYEHTLGKKEKLSVLVVTTPTTRPLASKLRQAFRKTGVAADAIASGKVGDQVAKYDAIYLMPGTTEESDIAVRYKRLTITGFEEEVKAGRAAIAVTYAKGKPRVVVNMARLREEKHELSAKVLSMFTLIR